MSLHFHHIMISILSYHHIIEYTTIKSMSLGEVGGLKVSFDNYECDQDQIWTILLIVLIYQNVLKISVCENYHFIIEL